VDGFYYICVSVIASMIVTLQVLCSYLKKVTAVSENLKAVDPKALTCRTRQYHSIQSNSFLPPTVVVSIIHDDPK
jgi:hypothetical protein